MFKFFHLGAHVEVLADVGHHGHEGGEGEDVRVDQRLT